MAEKEYKIGSQGPFKYDDALFPAALDTDGTIRAGTTPAGGTDVVRLDDLGSLFAPHDASYVVIGLDANLTAERVLAVNATNLSLVDGGAEGNVTINTIQNIDVTATPEFVGITLSGLDVGHIPYIAAGGVIATDNGQLFWDAANNRLGVRTASPDEALHVNGTGLVRIKIESTDNEPQLQLTDSAGSWYFFKQGTNLVMHDGIQVEHSFAGDGNVVHQGVIQTLGAGNNYFAGKIGVGVTDPDTLLELYKVGTQLKLSGGAADYATFAVSAAGALTITTVDVDAALGHIALMPDGFVGIGTDAPLTHLHILEDAAGGAAPDVSDKMIIEDAGFAFLNFITGDAVWSGILMSDGVRSRGAYLYDHDVLTERAIIYAGGAERVSVLANGYTGILVADPHSALEVNGAVSSGALTITASASGDNLDVSGINTLFVNPAAAVTISGFTGGVNGQELRVVVIDDDQNVSLLHAEGDCDQDILLHKGLDETIDSHYGGWNLVCNGVSWFDESHAKHV